MADIGDRRWKYTGGESVSCEIATVKPVQQRECSLVTAATGEVQRDLFCTSTHCRSLTQESPCENGVCLHSEQWFGGVPLSVRTNGKQNVTAVPVLGKPVSHFLTSQLHHLPLAPLANSTQLRPAATPCLLSFLSPEYRLLVNLLSGFLAPRTSDLYIQGVASLNKSFS